ncbi:hypothetical protein DMUE_2104 [Dictyocoela muelleri]|nr:hypothetical protein DMUE_2104 [Dictyocoela muelleri]
MFYLVFVSALQFHLRNSNKKYIGGKDISTPRLGVNTDADLFEIEELPDGWFFFIAKNKDDKIFDIAGDYTDLIYYSHRHGGPNQRFKFQNVTGRGVMITNPKGCIEYIPSKNAFQRKPCSVDNEFQIFTVVSPSELLQEIKSEENITTPPPDLSNKSPASLAQKMNDLKPANLVPQLAALAPNIANLAANLTAPNIATPNLNDLLYPAPTPAEVAKALVPKIGAMQLINALSPGPSVLDVAKALSPESNILKLAKNMDACANQGSSNQNPKLVINFPVAPPFMCPIGDKNNLETLRKLFGMEKAPNNDLMKMFGIDDSRNNDAKMVNTGNVPNYNGSNKAVNF